MITKKTKALRLNNKVFRPVYDIGYEQLQEFSQYRNGYHVIYKALHTLNVLFKSPVTATMIYSLLKLSPRSGGKAFYISKKTLSTYLSNNKYNLWRKVATTSPALSKTGAGHPNNMYIALGLSVKGERLKNVPNHV